MARGGKGVGGAQGKKVVYFQVAYLSLSDAINDYCCSKFLNVLRICGGRCLVYPHMYWFYRHVPILKIIMGVFSD